MGIGLIIGGVFIIIGVSFSIYVKEGVFVVPTIFVGACLFGVSSLISAAFYGSVVGVESTEIESIEIYSIGIRDSIEGSFTLGCGSINTEYVYSYYTKDDDDCFILNKTYCNISKIKETNDISPCIKRYREVFKDGKTSRMWAFGNYIYGDPDYYIIYIPEGSIVQTYTITP